MYRLRLPHIFRRRRGKFLLTSLVLLLLGLVADRFVAPRHLPWRPLDMDAPIGLATGTKITLIAFAPSKVCLNKLAEANHLSHTQAAPKHQGHCGWSVATTMTEANRVSFRPHTVTQQCPLMIASYIWLGDVDKQARTLLGSPLVKVHHAGTYSCRRQRGNGSGAWSEHAFANAWDITGFELKDGRVISVLKDWNNTNTKLSGKERRARARFLRKARDRACRLFRVVLSPDYNVAHRDHFHLDNGPALSCR